MCVRVTACAQSVCWDELLQSSRLQTREREPGCVRVYFIGNIAFFSHLRTRRWLIENMILEAFTSMALKASLSRWLTFTRFCPLLVKIPLSCPLHGRDMQTEVCLIDLQLLHGLLHQPVRSQKLCTRASHLLDVHSV